MKLTLKEAVGMGDREATKKRWIDAGLGDVVEFGDDPETSEGDLVTKEDIRKFARDVRTRVLKLGRPLRRQSYDGLANELFDMLDAEFGERKFSDDAEEELVLVFPKAMKWLQQNG